MIGAVPGRKLILIIAMMKDKNIEGCLAALLPLAHIVICTQIEHARSATVPMLQHKIHQKGLAVHGVATPSDAVALATRLADPQDLICVTGSLFLVGAVKSLLAGSRYAPIVG
jgi:dihydrofolate synthase/folylpolyglutamate synthase